MTRNCPWNRCAFCAVYKGEAFSRRLPDDLLADIDRLADAGRRVRLRLGLAPGAELVGAPDALSVVRDPQADPEERRMALWLLRGEGKVFLQDADSLVLPASKVAAVLTHLRQAIPEVREVTSYARSRTLCAKSEAALRSLREAGLTRVHVGLESGSDAVLALIEKGCRAEHHVTGCRRALDGGLEVACYVMPGLGGRALSEVHAQETAKVLRRILPERVRLRTLWIDPGSPLFALERSGQFALLEEHEVVAEIRAVLDGLRGTPVGVVSDHDRNLLCDLEGRMDKDADQLFGLCDRFLALNAEMRDGFVLARRAGHVLYLDRFLADPALAAAFAQEARALLALGQGSLLAGMRASLGRRSI